MPEDPGEADRTRRRVFWSLPSGLYVIGSRLGDRRHAMTASWVVPLATEPKLIGVGVEQGALTLQLVREGGVFSVCTIARTDRALVRKFVKPPTFSPADGTLSGCPVHEEVTGAPILDGAVAWLDCRVERLVDFGSHALVAGVVEAAGFQTGEDTPVLRMEDTRMSYGG
ncbi:MAG TPA: flavin reductase family protein [Acidimicrobiales bacterium]|nr:flavin reductase family protein [Acidimicrobiales bacterium]